MRVSARIIGTAILLLLASSPAIAGDFEWHRDFDLRAQADPQDFRARLSARFRVGDLQIDTVLSNVQKPSDAYMVLRLGEMTAQPPTYVIEKYRAEKSKGWGALAKSLGIKPGSKDFHALKGGEDFYTDKGNGKGKSKGKGKKGKD